MVTDRVAPHRAGVSRRAALWSPAGLGGGLAAACSPGPGNGVGCISSARQEAHGVVAAVAASGAVGAWPSGLPVRLKPPRAATAIRTDPGPWRGAPERVSALPACAAAWGHPAPRRRRGPTPAALLLASRINAPHSLTGWAGRPLRRSSLRTDGVHPQAVICANSRARAGAGGRTAWVRLGAATQRPAGTGDGAPPTGGAASSWATA
jgi:hypothetical protein